MSYQDVVTIINDLRRHGNRPKKRDWDRLEKRSLFAYQSYYMWALGELRSYLELRKHTKPVYEVVEDFRYLMDCYACEARTPENNFMFSVAYDAVTSVLDEMLIIDQAFGEV